MITRRILLGGSVSMPFVQAKARPQRAGWMAGRWGIMLHWIAPGPAAKSGRRRQDLNDAVNGFDVDGLVEQVSGTKASWAIFTLGQNTGMYASPNSYLESIAGPGHTSARDLVLELARKLAAKKIALIVYAPGEIKAVSSLHSPFGWNPTNQQLFQLRYTTFLREYAERYGRYCAGWWIDGCYTWQDFPNSARDWHLWAKTLRAGNPNAVLSFNDGCFLHDHPYPLTGEQDLLSGEANGFGLTGPLVKTNDAVRTLSFAKSYLDRLACQAHVVAPLDNHGEWIFSGPGEIAPPPQSLEFLSEMIEHYRKIKVAITFNVGIYQEGLLGEQTLAVLRGLP